MIGGRAVIGYWREDEMINEEHELIRLVRGSSLINIKFNVLQIYAMNDDDGTGVVLREEKRPTKADIRQLDNDHPTTISYLARPQQHRILGFLDGVDPSCATLISSHNKSGDLSTDTLMRRPTEGRQNAN